MARKLSRKDLKHDEFVDTALDVGHWLEKNWRMLARGAGVVLGVAFVVLVGLWYVRHTRAQAAELVKQGIEHYKRAQQLQFADVDELAAALDAFEQAATKGGGAAPGRLAGFYRGATLYRLGRFEEAIAALEEHLDGAPPADTLTWSAQMLLVAALADAGHADRAVALLEELAGRPQDEYPVEQALLELGRIHMAQGNFEEAHRVWQRIVDEHPLSPASAEARSMLGPDAQL